MVHSCSGLQQGPDQSFKTEGLSYIFIPIFFSTSSDDLALQYISLWTLVLGAVLIWAMFHLKRNARYRQAVSKAKNLEEQIQHIFQHSRDVLFCIDLKKRSFDCVSPSCLSLTGYTGHDLEEMGVTGVFQRLHPEDQEAVRGLLEKGESRNGPGATDWSGTVDYRFLHRDGQYRTFSDYFYIKYDENMCPCFISGSARDVTPVKRLEENLAVLEKRFQDSRKMAELGLLAGSVAHDFNNLMTVIVGNVELALLKYSGTDGAVLDEIKKASLRAADLAHQMLVYTGKAPSTVSSIKISLLVKEMSALLDVSISKKVKIEYCLDSEILAVRAEASHIRQVIMNLITNASESIGGRPGVIAINTRNAMLRDGEPSASVPPGGLPAGTYVCLEVSDTGDGMDDETIQQVFEPFFTTKPAGRGLGLATLLNIVQKYQGAVEIKSEDKKGTVFRVYLRPETEKAQPEEKADGSSGEEREWRGCGTALIAEDEEAIREITGKLLEKTGFDVITAKDGLEAVDYYTENAEKITLLLTDLNMPRLNGVEAALRIRHISPNLPVVFMSGYPQEEVVKRLETQPRIGFLKKPFGGRELMDIIRHVMEKPS